LSIERSGTIPDRARRATELPRAVFVGVALASSLLLVVLSRKVFLFWDDFFFLGQARDSELTWAYLTDPLFQHFSPLSRLVDWVLVKPMPEHPWLIIVVLATLLVATVGATTWLMVALHGRSGPALVGALVLSPSLTLVPLGNWWTAGVNILPALTGFYVAFGAMVLVLRGGSRWWAAAVFAGAGVAVLAWELPMLLCGYLGLWFLLCGSRSVEEPLAVVVRRTWWVWAGVTAIGVAAALNYRLNYYDDSVARPSLTLTLHALWLSLVRTLLPTAVGFHDPRSDVFSTLSLVVGCVVLVTLVAWLVATREAAWRGLLFAAVGWLLPILALVLNRLSIYGLAVVDNAVYYHLPTVLVVIGLLEAWRQPRRRPVAVDPGPRVRRVLLASTALVVVAAYAWSAGPTADYQPPPGASAAYYERARDSAEELLARGTPFTVINSDAPWALVPDGFDPYNRADRVLAIVGPSSLTFDDPAPPYYRFTEDGDLRPVTVDWLAEADAASGELRLLGARRDPASPSGELCFRATRSSSVLWPLQSEVSGEDLVVRTLVRVERESTVRVNVQGGDADGFDRANKDGHVLSPDRTGVLDTVAQPSVSSVRVKDLTPGVHVCVDSVSVGRVVVPTG
jgi:hypothetical protein